jgi:hypothetical protein
MASAQKAQSYGLTELPLEPKAQPGCGACLAMSRYRCAPRECPVQARLQCRIRRKC